MTRSADLYLNSLLEGMSAPSMLHDDQEFKLGHAEGACAALRDFGLLTSAEDGKWRQTFRATSQALRVLRHDSYGRFAKDQCLVCPDCEDVWLHVRKVVVLGDEVIINLECEMRGPAHIPLAIQTHKGNTYLGWKDKGPVELSWDKA